MQTFVQLPPAEWDVDNVIKYQKPMHGLSDHQQNEVNHFILRQGMSYQSILVQCDRPGQPSKFEVVDNNRRLPFEFSICNVCHTALCEHKEGRSDWPAR